MATKGGLHVDISSTELDALVRRLSHAPGVIKTEMKKGMRDATNAVRREMRSAMPRSTGKLRGSVRTSVSFPGGEVRGRVFPKKLYAQIVEGGAKAHVIKPRRAKVLRFANGGYARRAMHPGQRAQHYIAAAIANSKGAVDDAFKAAIQRLGEHIAKGGGLFS